MHVSIGKILIAEDNTEIKKVLKLYLAAEGYQVYLANDGAEALQLFKHEDISMIIADLMMPKVDGYDLINRIRQSSKVPILILSAKGEDNEKILGLSIGADDYMTKPFNPLEVVARVNAAHRRMEYYDSELSSVISVGGITMNLSQFTVYKGNMKIELTASEFKILKLLMESPGRIFSKAMISEYINGQYYENDDNTIMVHISKIRDKIGKKLIKTVRGLGYKFDEKKI